MECYNSTVNYCTVLAIWKSHMENNSAHGFYSQERPIGEIKAL